MKKEFLRVCAVEELEELKGFRFIVDDVTDIALFKVKGEIFAVDNVCPHNHTPKMHLGYIEDDHVLCPIHFFKFSLKTGERSDDVGCTLPTYEVKIEGNDVYVEKPDNKFFNFDF
jgi:nitrite reductase/ring-hydroxylating ferredoxin subunit